MKFNEYKKIDELASWLIKCKTMLCHGQPLDSQRIALKIEKINTAHGECYLFYLTVNDKVFKHSSLKVYHKQIKGHGRELPLGATIKMIKNNVLDVFADHSIETPTRVESWCQCCYKEFESKFDYTYLLCDECKSESLFFADKSDLDGLKKEAYQDGYTNAMKSFQVNHERNTNDRKVYCIQKGSEPVFKIGISVDPKSRLSSLQTASDTSLRIVHIVECRDALKLEAKLHRKFSSKRLSGEWFELNEQDIEFVKGL